MKTHIVKVEEDDTGALGIPIPEEILVELDWQPEDELVVNISDGVARVLNRTALRRKNNYGYVL